MDLILKVEGLHVDLPLPAGRLKAVRNVGFEVNQGETLSLVGESGCGKSLTALALMDLLPPRAVRRAGKLFFEGRDLSGASENTMAQIRGDRMAMIFQEPMTSLNPCYTIGNQLVEAYLQHRRARCGKPAKGAVFLLEKVGITAAGSRLKQFPHQLSGGYSPADHDRHGADVRTEPDHRRRADHGAGRDHSGPDPGTFGRSSAEFRMGLS
jgi:peptide/nickel transport system ATP-binding protein